MAGAACSATLSLQTTVIQQGYAFVQGVTMREVLGGSGSLDDWATFAASWNSLPLDEYMADGGRYRRRRHASFAAARAGAVVRQPHQAHYQPLAYNPLHGGVERWFGPIAPEAAAGNSLQTILRFCLSFFGSLARLVDDWHVEVHQFRIEARPGEAGRPTPEGLHRDGVDYVLVLLVARRNIASGVTAIHALDGRPLGHFTLAHPFDAAIVDDARVAHGVTPVEAIAADQPAYRDVLVVTFIDARRAPKAAGR
jgi:hypothetical protein